MSQGISIYVMLRAYMLATDEKNERYVRVGAGIVMVMLFIDSAVSLLLKLRAMP